MNNNQLTDLLSAASSDDMINFKEKLYSILDQKTKDSLETLKQETSQNFITTEESIDEKLQKALQ